MLSGSVLRMFFDMIAIRRLIIDYKAENIDQSRIDSYLCEGKRRWELPKSI